jgi:hypothetical protein
MQAVQRGAARCSAVNPLTHLVAARGLALESRLEDAFDELALGPKGGGSVGHQERRGSKSQMQ